MKYSLLLLVGTPILIFLLIQLTPVQNAIKNYATNRINSSIDGAVSIDHIDISIRRGLKLEGFQLTEGNGDTIMVADALNISLSKSLYSLFDNAISLNKVVLENPTVRIVKYECESKSNLDVILEKFVQPSSNEKGGDPLNINLYELEVYNLNLELIDENASESQSVQLKYGYLEVNTFLKNNLLDLKQLILEEPVIRLKKYGESIELDTEIETVKKIETAIQDDSTSLAVKVGYFEIMGGVFSMNDYNKIPTVEDILDLNHFELADLNLKVARLVFKNETDIRFDLNKFNFVDDKGFKVESLTCRGVEIDSNAIRFPRFSFITDRTNLSESLSLEFDSFDDFNRFEQEVELKANFKSSRLYFGDLMHFVKNLNTSSFFIQNKNRSVRLAGQVSGPIDHLIGRNMQIGVGNKLNFLANFSMRNITRKGGEFFHFGMKSLETDMNFLKSFIPGFNPPDNFNKLGKIKFKGNFDGYLKDFVAYGTLNSAVGDAFMDMRLDIKDGSSLAQYSGELSLEQFDMGRWTDNEDFGIVDFSASITDGKGLTLNSVYAELFATVESLTFKDYEYRDFVMDAQVDKNKFNGEFSISDENIDFVFDGNIELRDSVPHLDFKANIENVDLYTLNLSKKPLSIQGSVDINGYGNSINDIVGNMIASDLLVNTNDTIYQMDTISLTAYETANDNRKIKLFSDIASVELEGYYNLQTILPATKYLLKQSYPHFTQNWEVSAPKKEDVQDLRFDISIFESKNFFELFGIEEMSTQNFKAKGSLDTKRGDLSFASTVPYFQIQDNSFWFSQVLISSDNKSGDVLINIDSTVIGSDSYNPIDIQSTMKGDTVNFLVSTTEIVDSLESIDVEGRIIPHPKGYQINITDNEIEALGGVWSVAPDNEVIIGSSYHSINNLNITDGYRSIAIDDVENKGIALYLSDFNFSTISGIIDYDKMDFAGEGDFSLYVDDVYVDKNIIANLYIEDFTINGDSYGALELDMSKDNGEPAGLLMSLGNTHHDLLVNATIDPEKDNYVDAKVKGSHFPLHIFEYIIRDGIKNTYGGVDLEVDVNGPISNLKLDGKGLLNGGVTIIYTGVDYTFENQEVRLTEKVVDLTGAEILDPERGVGTIDGGLNHDLFRDFTIDATISGQDVIALNTTKFDNPLYYGLGKGDMQVNFTGPFHLVNMKINATAKEESVLNIPIWEGETSTDKNFIQFITREEMVIDVIKKDREFRFEGLDIEIDLTMTPAARVNIIFDESRGDIIQGNGRGNLKMNITRYGDFDMYGTYEIERGEYLFTALGAVAKPFKVRRGGQIRWTGDPINATLSINADYQVRTSMEVFLSEFVTDNPKLENSSRSKTQVELILNLGGTLYNPKVNFGLNFPDLDSELRNVAQSKLRTLNANQAELNSQVLGLIVFNSFLPGTSSQINLGGADIGSAGIGTLSEFVSSQLSLLFTGLLNEALADNGLISGIDFDIGLRKNTFNGVSNNEADILPDEIEVSLKNRFKFLDERLSLDLSGNYVREDVFIGGNYFIGDFVLEYFLTDDRKLKLRMYGRYDLDEIEGNRRQRYGLGLGYRTEFGTLSDFKQTMSQQFRNSVGESVDSQ
ncbi:MAG: translocation/assembly module TamB domain-containing protein [Saprospiraceae bacterium]|nr:translocation/assembly module TamB domain-containing protein [Saprospiraceae bacterium]